VYLKKYSILILFLFCNLGCEKKEILQLIEPEIFVSTAYISSSSISIEVNCELVNPSSVIIEEYGICWAEKPMPTIKDGYQYSNNNTTEEGPFSELIANSKSNTKYYIRGYIRVAGKDIYSKEYIYEPKLALGWNRLDDVPRVKGVLNLPNAFLQGNSIPTFLRKQAGLEESYEFVFNDLGNFWSNDIKATGKMIYNQFTADIEYDIGKFDFISGGGYQIENIISGKKKYLKNAKTNTFNVIDDYPGADVASIGFGAGNKAFVIEVKPNPKMYAFNEENFLWETMKNPPFENFTGIKATRANGNGIVILENEIEKDAKMKVYYYNFNTDSWNIWDDFPGPDRVGGVLFSIKNKVYFGLGEQKVNESGLKDIWELDLTTKKWRQLVNYPGGGSTNIAFVKKGNSVYLGMGYSSILTTIGTSKKFIAYDFWEFRP
jgi:hypothetical protein